MTTNGPTGPARTLSRRELRSRRESSIRRTGLTVGRDRIFRGPSGRLMTEREARSAQSVAIGGPSGRVLVVDDQVVDVSLREAARVSAELRERRAEEQRLLSEQRASRARLDRALAAQAFARMQRSPEERAAAVVSRVNQTGVNQSLVNVVRERGAVEDRRIMSPLRVFSGEVADRAGQQFRRLSAVALNRNVPVPARLLAARSGLSPARTMALFGTTQSVLESFPAVEALLREFIADARGVSDERQTLAARRTGFVDEVGFSRQLPQEVFGLSLAAGLAGRGRLSSTPRPSLQRAGTPTNLFRGSPAISRRAVLERGIAPESPAARLVERPLAGGSPVAIRQTTFAPASRALDPAVSLRLESARLGRDAALVTQRLPAETAGLAPQQASLTQFVGVAQRNPFRTLQQVQETSLRPLSRGELPFRSAQEARNTLFISREPLTGRIIQERQSTLFSEPRSVRLSDGGSFTIPSESVFSRPASGRSSGLLDVLLVNGRPSTVSIPRPTDIGFGRLPTFSRPDSVLGSDSSRLFTSRLPRAGVTSRLPFSPSFDSRDTVSSVNLLSSRGSSSTPLISSVNTVQEATSQIDISLPRVVVSPRVQSNVVPRSRSSSRVVSRQVSRVAPVLTTSQVSRVVSRLPFSPSTPRITTPRVPRRPPVRPPPPPRIRLPRLDSEKSFAQSFRVSVGLPGNRVFRDLGVGGESLISKARNIAFGGAAASITVRPIGSTPRVTRVRGLTKSKASPFRFIQPRGERLSRRSEVFDVTRFRTGNNLLGRVGGGIKL